MEINGSDLEVWFKKRINSRISWVNGCPDIIDNISFDTRKITGLNTIFVALNGDKKDGHDFATKAKYAGAIGCIVSRELEIDIPQIVVKDTLRALLVLFQPRTFPHQVYFLAFQNLFLFSSWVGLFSGLF